MTFFHKVLYKILLETQSINKIRLINKIEKKIWTLKLNYA